MLLRLNIANSSLSGMSVAKERPLTCLLLCTIKLWCTEFHTRHELRLFMHHPATSRAIHADFGLLHDGAILEIGPLLQTHRPWIMHKTPSHSLVALVTAEATTHIENAGSKADITCDLANCQNVRPRHAICEQPPDAMAKSDRNNHVNTQCPVEYVHHLVPCKSMAVAFTPAADPTDSPSFWRNARKLTCTCPGHVRVCAKHHVRLQSDRQDNCPESPRLDSLLRFGVALPLTPYRVSFHIELTTHPIGC